MAEVTAAALQAVTEEVLPAAVAAAALQEAAEEVLPAAAAAAALQEAAEDRPLLVVVPAGLHQEILADLHLPAAPERREQTDGLP